MRWRHSDGKMNPWWTFEIKHQGRQQFYSLNMSGGRQARVEKKLMRINLGPSQVQSE